MIEFIIFTDGNMSNRHNSFCYLSNWLKVWELRVMRNYQQYQTIKSFEILFFMGCVCLIRVYLCANLLDSRGHHTCIFVWIDGTNIHLVANLSSSELCSSRGRLITESPIELHSNLTYWRHLDSEKFDHLNLLILQILIGKQMEILKSMSCNQILFVHLDPRWEKYQVQCNYSICVHLQQRCIWIWHF